MALRRKPRGLTRQDVRDEFAGTEVTVRLKDGEYRVNIKGWGEGPAYYTDDAADAIQTGHRMHDEFKARGGVCSPSCRLQHPHGMMPK